MASLRQNVRAWLAILVLQALGSVWMCYSTRGGSTHYANPSPSLSRSHALPVIILLAMRLCLIFLFESYALHVTHIVGSVLSALHTSSEVFLFKAMKYNFANATEITLNGLTAVLLLALLSRLTQQPEPIQERRRTGRLFASHYMEGDVLNNVDKNDDVVKTLNKKKKN